jgi:hypothetical protein
MELGEGRGGHKHEREDYILMDLKETGFEAVNWILLSRD